MSEYIPGLNCKCQARSEYECACDDVDWTPREVYQLRAERDRYKSALEEIVREYVEHDYLSYFDAYTTAKQSLKGGSDE